MGQFGRIHAGGDGRRTARGCAGAVGSASDLRSGFLAALRALGAAEHGEACRAPEGVTRARKLIADCSQATDNDLSVAGIGRRASRA